MVFTAAKKLNITNEELNDMTMQFFVDVINEHIEKDTPKKGARIATPQEAGAFFGEK